MPKKPSTPFSPQVSWNKLKDWRPVLHFLPCHKSPKQRLRPWQGRTNTLSFCGQKKGDGFMLTENAKEQQFKWRIHKGISFFFRFFFDLQISTWVSNWSTKNTKVDLSEINKKIRIHELGSKKTLAENPLTHWFPLVKGADSNLLSLPLHLRSSWQHPWLQWSWSLVKTKFMKTSFCRPSHSAKEAWFLPPQIYNICVY